MSPPLLPEGSPLAHASAGAVLEVDGDAVIDSIDGGEGHHVVNEHRDLPDQMHVKGDFYLGAIHDGTGHVLENKARVGVLLGASDARPKFRVSMAACLTGVCVLRETSACG